MKSYGYILFLTILTIFMNGCKKQSDCPDPKGYQQYGEPFSNVPATEDMVMYEVNLRAFSQEGNLAGVHQKLDYLVSLGVNVIWLMPIQTNGGPLNSPYCISNFYEVDEEYGTLEDLRTFVAEAHSRNMAVILDWVANHTSWDHPWIDSTGWYTTDAQGNIIHPSGTNWTDVADLNFDNTALQEQMIDAMRYWVLEANVDGYRCDAADYVPFDFWQKAIDSLRFIPNREIIMLAEGARVDHFDAGFDMNFDWNFYNKGKEIFNQGTPATHWATLHQYTYGSIEEGKHKLRFTSNHDECAWHDTPIGLYGSLDASIAAFAATLFYPGVPLLYTGQEIGYPTQLPFFSNLPVDWNYGQSTLSRYQQLMEVYKTHDVCRNGVFEDFSSTDAVLFKRVNNQETLWCIINTKNNSYHINVPNELQGVHLVEELTGQQIGFSNTLELLNFGVYLFFIE
ncbi:MAG: alpha-amylase family glycosyl hydrolase [Bacteroidota bacterium]|nr:alpha-amylase family glycosyl hydrolase [Bacteroidota bacterium]